MNSLEELKQRSTVERINVRGISITLDAEEVIFILLQQIGSANGVNMSSEHVSTRTKWVLTADKVVSVKIEIIEDFDKTEQLQQEALKPRWNGV